MTAPKERPIIFSGPMVRAILEGRKTQTRRVIAKQHLIPRATDLSGFTDNFSVVGHDFYCPFGRPGDRLWVREAWCGSMTTEVFPFAGQQRGIVAYRADHAPDASAPVGGRWRPSIHMPRWASRLTLEVTGVRVERLQSITPDDARAEGHPHVPGTERYPQEVHDEAARDWFMDLWDDINAKRGHAWDTNPWVWVVEFRRVEA